MTDQHDDQHDELRDRLRAADPASSLPPAGPERATRLVEDVMSTELTTENRATGTRNRGPLTWLVAAAAVLIIAGVGVFAVVSHDDDPAAPPTAADHTTVTELGAPSPATYDARCMVPNAETLAQQSLAFDGTVTALAGRVVTLTVGHWYAGGPTDLVRVQAPEEALQDLVGAVHFEDGGRYLVSASDGQVTVCGFSAPYSADLAALYDQAFG
ncbi:hypothetical protein [Nocardioides sp. URHA0032]|uniref:hypothetical protein n=1 Tax=Nocardioides sp. URHA0032 TaxID=1380388 RepID=UPI00048E01E9|nr:hypothetical protein [Nocardioides sp. URHA0032]